MTQLRTPGLTSIAIVFFCAICFGLPMISVADPPAEGPPGPTAATPAPPPAQGVSTDELDERVTDLEDSIQMLEDDMEQILGTQDQLKNTATQNKLNWQGEYRVTMNMPYLRDDTNDFYVTHAELVLDSNGMPIIVDGQPLVSKVGVRRRRGIDEWQEPSWVHRLRLTMQFDMTDKLRFYGRLAVYKYFNEVRNEGSPLDMYSNSYPSNSIMGLERAYFDWFVAKWLVLTMGRISSPDGPPAELKENTERRAGWGLQMIEAEIEAAMLTFHFSKLLEGTLLKLFYAPFGTHSPFSLSEQSTLFAKTDIKLMHSFGGLLETKIAPAGDNLIQIGFVSVPQFRPRNLAVTVRGVDEPVWPDEPSGNNLGSYSNINGLIAFKDIGGSGLDIFGSYLITFLKSTEDRMVYKVPVKDLPILHPVTGQEIQKFTGTADYEIGLASYEQGPDKLRFGHMAFGGFRLTFPWTDYWTRLGGEFNYATRYHISWSAPTDLLARKLATKGWAAEGYLIQQLVPEHLFIRVGYLQVMRQYSGLYIGPTARADQEIRNIYALVNVAW